MSRKGNCYDNAPMESFFKSFKIEEVVHAVYDSHEEAVRASADYIDRFYHTVRLHSALEYLSPNPDEQQAHVETQEELEIGARRSRDQRSASEPFVGRSPVSGDRQWRQRSGFRTCLCW